MRRLLLLSLLLLRDAARTPGKSVAEKTLMRGAIAAYHSAAEALRPPPATGD